MFYALAFVRKLFVVSCLLKGIFIFWGHLSYVNSLFVYGVSNGDGNVVELPHHRLKML